MKITNLLKWALIALAASYVAFGITVFFFSEAFFGFLQGLSPDGNIGNPSKVTYTFNLYFLLMAAILFFSRAAFSEGVKRPAFSELSGHVKTFYVASLVIILVNIFFHNNQFLHAEDGVQEYLTAGLALVASGICLVLTFRCDGWVSRAFWMGFTVLLFFFGMEEISWGQRIIGWETPEGLAEINTQGESNLHNIFNDIFNIVYIIFAIVIGTIVYYRDWVINLLEKIPGLGDLTAYVPSREFFYSGMLFLFLAAYTNSFFDGGGETMEAVFSVFITAYAYDMLQRVGEKEKFSQTAHSLAEIQQ